MNKSVQSIYPLTAKQETLLFHCLQPGSQDPGFLQVRFSLVGAINRSRVEAAWAATLQRHEALRMSLKFTSKPLLIVRTGVSPTWTWHDLRNETSPVQQERINAFLDTDRVEGIELSSSPPMRFAAFQVSEDRVDFVWSCHHLFFDGWSAILALQEMIQLYEGTQLASPSSYKSYLTWLRRQPRDTAYGFWQTELSESAGRETGSLPKAWCMDSSSSGVAVSDDRPGEPELSQQHIVLDEALCERMTQAAADLRVTLASLAGAAWALLLAATGSCSDVTYGNTVSGRSPDLPGSDGIVGFLSHVVPIRCDVDGDQTLPDFVGTVQRSRFASESAAFLPLGEIQEAASLRPGESLFESLLVFENLPEITASTSLQNGVELRDYSSGTTSTYPVTVVMKPGATWVVDCVCTRQVNQPAVWSAVQLLPSLLDRICDSRDSPIGELLVWVQSNLAKQFSRPAASTVERPLDEPTMDKVDPHQPGATGVASDGEPMRAPSTPTELALSRIWEELLGKSSLDVDTEFLQLGGRSIAAVRMAAKIEAALGCQLSLVDIVAHPTIAKLAKLIDGEETKTPWRSLVPLRTAGSQPPIFFVHAGGGHVLFLRSLLPHLAPDRGLFGLQPVGLDGECEPMSTFEEIAAHFLDEIRIVQPKGPYHFVGHCQGAKVAFEMMRQLRADGQHVAMLLILDTLPPLLQAIPSRGARMKKSAREITGAFRRGQFSKGVGIASGVVVQLLEGATKRFQELYRRKVARRTWATQTPRQAYLEAVEQACRVAYGKYVATGKADNVTLISTDGARPEHLGWAQLTDNFRQIVIPVGHYRMFMEPEVQHLATAINQAIARSESSEPSELAEELTGCE